MLLSDAVRPQIQRPPWTAAPGSPYHFSTPPKKNVQYGFNKGVNIERNGLSNLSYNPFQIYFFVSALFDILVAN